MYSYSNTFLNEVFVFVFMTLQCIHIRIPITFVCIQPHVINFHACLICTLRNYFFVFFTLSSPFRNVFSVTLTTASNSFLNLWIF